MTALKSRSTSGLRLTLLLVGLALTNLANSDVQVEPTCNCSTYPGLMTIDPPYLVLREGEAGTLRASYPSGVRWSIGETPDTEVISELSTAFFFSSLTADLTAVGRIDDPNAFFHGEGEASFFSSHTAPDSGEVTRFFIKGPFREVPARKTQLEIIAQPNDPAFSREVRRASVLVIIPWLYLEEILPGRFDPDGVTRNLNSIAIVDSFSDEEWNFTFDVSDAPSFRAPLGVQRRAPNAVDVEFPLGDTLHWRISALNPRYSYCLVEEPIHVTATDGIRMVRRTVVGRIVGGRGSSGICPQPTDPGN